MTIKDRLVSGKLRTQEAYTLVELLVVMALTVLIVSAIYNCLGMQQKSHVRQSLIIELQQNLRMAMELMIEEIRMAGYDPTKSGAFGFQNLPGDGRYTGEDGVSFTVDADDDGTVDSSESEDLAFRLNVKDGKALADEDKDNLLRQFGRKGATWKQLAENIMALGFAYAYEGGTDWAVDSSSPPDGLLDLNLDTNHDGEVDESDNPAGQVIAPPVPIDRIRCVKIWLLGRTRLRDKEYVDTKTYVVGRARITPNNNYVHRCATATVYCRNLPR